MSQKITVEACTKEPRVYKGQVQWGVKLPGNGGWVTLYREKRPIKGEVIEVNITERQGYNGGPTYRDAFPVMPPLAPVEKDKETAGQGDKEAEKKDERLKWDDVRAIAEAAHEMAMKMEPDLKDVEPTEEGNRYAMTVDRSKARIALVNTILIAFTSGKFIVPEVDDMAPPADTDDVPW